MEVAEECGWSNWTRLKRTEEKSQRHEILKNKQHYREEQLSQLGNAGRTSDTKVNTKVKIPSTA